MADFVVSTKTKLLIFWLSITGDMAIARNMEVLSNNLNDINNTRAELAKSNHFFRINILDTQRGKKSEHSPADSDIRGVAEKIHDVQDTDQDQTNIEKKSGLPELKSTDKDFFQMNNTCNHMALFCLKSLEGSNFTMTIPRKIVINLKINQLSYFEYGILIDQWNVGTGRPGRNTPTGMFYIREKESCPPYFGSRGDHNTPGCTPENPFGPRILWFIGHLYGIHGTNQESLIGSRSTVESRRVSGGCVRNPNEKILWLFPRVKVGDPIEIIN